MIVKGKLRQIGFYTVRQDGINIYSLIVIGNYHLKNMAVANDLASYLHDSRDEVVEITYLKSVFKKYIMAIKLENGQIIKPFKPYFQESFFGHLLKGALLSLPFGIIDESGILSVIIAVLIAIALTIRTFKSKNALDYN